MSEDHDIPLLMALAEEEEERRRLQRLHRRRRPPAGSGYPVAIYLFVLVALALAGVAPLSLLLVGTVVLLGMVAWRRFR